MNVLNRKLLRELLAAKGVLLAILGIIATGVMCFVGMGSLYRNLETSRQRYYAQCRMADFTLSVKKVPISELQRIKNLQGVTEVHPRIVFNVTADMPTSDKLVSGRLISLPDRPDPVINQVLLKRGSYFSDQQREEVIVNDGFATAHNLRPGDTLTLLMNNRRQELRIVGTAISAEFVYIIGPGAIVPDPQSFGIFYIPQSYAEEAFDFDGACNEIVGTLATDRRERPEALLGTMETLLDDYGVIATTPLADHPSHLFLTSEIQQLRTNAIVIPVIFLGIAALILNVLMRRLIEQQRTIVGTLKAIGYRDRTLIWHYLKFGACVGWAGGSLGGVAGYFLAGVMTQEYVRYFEFPELINRPYPQIVVIGLGISLMCSLLGAIRGVRSVIRLSPAEAMRPKPPPTGKRTLIERWAWLWKRLDSRWQMVFRGVFRNRRRTIVGMLAACAGSAIILLTLHLRDSVLEMVEFQYSRVLLSDFDVNLKDEHDYACVDEARRLPGVTAVEPVFGIGCTFHHGHRQKDGGVTGLIANSTLTVPCDIHGGRVPVPPTGVVLTRRLAEILDVQPGDELVIEPVDGRRDLVKMPVMRIVDSYLGTAAYADFHYLNRKMSNANAVTTLQFRLANDPAQVKEFYKELKQLPAVQSLTPIRENRETLNDLVVDKMMIAVVVITGFAGLIFFGSILNASLISFAERQSEIATFRVLGYTPHEVGSIFLRENLLVTIAGSLLGLPVGYWMCVGMVQLFATDLFRLPFIITPLSWILPVLLGIAFALLAHWPVQRAIKKMDVVQALNVKE